MIDFTVAAWSAINFTVKGEVEEIICRPKIIDLVFQLPDEIYNQMGLKILQPQTQFSIEWVSLVNKRLKTWLPLKVVLSDENYLPEGTVCCLLLGNVVFRGRYDFRIIKYEPKLFNDDGKPVIEVPDDYSPPYKLDIKSLKSNNVAIDKITRDYRRAWTTDRKEYLILDKDSGSTYKTGQHIDPGCLLIILTRIYRNYLWLGWKRRTAILQYTEEDEKNEYEKYIKLEHEFKNYLVNYLGIKDNRFIDIVNKEIIRAQENKLYIFDGTDE